MLAPRRYPLKLGTAQISVELVWTKEDIARGLSGRAALGDDEGMLFDLGYPPTGSFFWMKGVAFDLDLVFMNRDGLVEKIARNAKAGSEARIPYGWPVWYVLEVPGGWCARHDVTPGKQAAF
jgi:uncharacterized membrane protein (UPF0127 family)